MRNVDQVMIDLVDENEEGQIYNMAFELCTMDISEMR